MSVIDEGIHVVDERRGDGALQPAGGAERRPLPEEVIGRHLLEVFPSLTPATSTLLKVLATGKPIPAHEQTFTNYKGQRVTTVNSTLPIFHEGRLVGAIEVSKDVTRVRELSERVAGLQAALLRPRSRREAPGGRRPVHLRRPGGRAPRHAAAEGTGPPGGRHRLAGPGVRRDGHGQGAAGARDPRGQLRGGPAAGGAELRGPARGAAGVAPLRHGRGSFTGAEDRPGSSSWPTAARSTWTRSTPCRRSCRPSCCGCCRTGASAGWARPPSGRWTCGSSPPPTRSPAAALASGGSGSDLYYRITVVALEMPPLRRAAPRTSRCSPTTSWTSTARGWGCRRRPLSRRWRRSSSGTPGRATCGSWSTPSRRPLQMATGPEIRLSDLPGSPAAGGRGGGATRRGRRRAGRGPLPETRG